MQDPLLVEVRNVVGDAPGDELFAYAEVAPDAVPEWNGYENPDLTTIALTVVPGKRMEAEREYALVVSSVPARTGGSVTVQGQTEATYYWYDAKQDVYASGRILLEASSGGLWQAHADKDFAFFVTMDDPPAEPGIENPGPQSVDEGGSLSIPLVVTNPEQIQGITAVSADPGLLTVQVTQAAQGWTLELYASDKVAEDTDVQVTIRAHYGAPDPLEVSFTVTVLNLNDPPVISGLDNVQRDGLVVSEDSSLILEFWVRDEETPSENLTVTIEADDTFDGTTPFFTPQPVKPEASGRVYIKWDLTPDVWGETTVTVRASDGDKDSAVSFRLQIIEVNDPPTLHAPSTVTMKEDEVAENILVWAEDPDGPEGLKRLSLSASSSNSQLLPSLPDAGGYGIHVTPVTGEPGKWHLTLKPKPNQFGSAQVTLHLRDGTYTILGTISVYVEAVNDPPTVGQVDDQVVSFGSGTFEIPLDVSDLESFTYAIQVNVDWDNPSLLSQVQPYYSEYHQRHFLRITPAAGQTGETTITVTAHDGMAASQPMQFKLEIAKAPAFAPDVPTTLELMEDQDPKQILVTVEDATSLTAVSSNPSVLAVEVGSQVGNSWTLTLTPLENQVGRVIVTLTAQNKHFETKRPLTVDIVNVNDPPTVTGIPSDVETDEDVIKQIPFTIHDPDPYDQHIVKVEVVQNLEPPDRPVAQVTVLGTGANRTLHVAPFANVTGRTRYRLLVEDAAGAKADPVEFIVTVNEIDDPPIINIPHKPIIDEDSPPQTYVITVTDPDSTGPIELTAVSYDVAFELTPQPDSTNAWLLTVIPAQNQSGDVHITLTATSAGLTTETVLVIHIREINDPPVLTLPVVRDETFEDQPYLLKLTITDPDTDISKLKVTATSDNLALLPPSSFEYSLDENKKPQMMIRPAPDQNGVATVTISVFDGFDTVTRSFELVVIPQPDAPRLEGVGDTITINEDQSFDRQVRVYDPDVPGGPVSVQIEYSGDVLGCPSDDPCEPVRLIGTGESRRLVIEPKPNANGQATIRLILTAGEEGAERIGERVLTLLVEPVNDPPEILAIHTFDIMEDDELKIIAKVYVDDIDSDLERAVVTATPADPATLPINPGNIQRNVVGGILEVYISAKPADDRFGTVPVTVRVTDDGGLTVSQTFAVNIKPINDPPTFTPGKNIEVFEDAPPQEIKGWATNISAGPYEQAQKLTFVLQVDETTQDPNRYPTLFAEGPAISPDGTLTFTLAPNAHGSALVRVQLKDDGGVENGGLDISAVHPFTITVKSVNDPPFIGPIPNYGTDVGTPTGLIELDVYDEETPTADLEIWATSSNTSLVPNTAANIYVRQGESPAIRLTPVEGKTGTTTITVFARDPGDESGQGSEVGQRSFDLIVNNLSLSGLEPSIGTLSPAFDPRILSYMVPYSGWVPQVQVTAYAADPDVRIRIEGQDVPSGKASQAIRLGENGGEVRVEVYSPQPEVGVSKTYTLTFVRQQSTVAELADLSITPGELQPKFDPKRYNYTATVPYEVTAVTVNARPGDVWTKVTVEGHQNLRVGSNRIVVTVTAESGERVYYYIDVTRLPGPLTIQEPEVEAGADWATLKFSMSDAASVTVYYRPEGGTERSRSGGYGSSHTVTLTGLEPATAYSFRIQAERSIGTGAELASSFRTAAPEARGLCEVGADGSLTCPFTTTAVAQARQILPNADPNRIAVAAATDRDMGAAVAEVLAADTPEGQRVVTVRLDDLPNGVALLDEAALRRAAGAGVAVRVESPRGGVTLTPSLLAELRLGADEQLAVALTEGEIDPDQLEPWLGVGGYRQVGEPLAVSLVRITPKGMAPVTTLPSPLVVSHPAYVDDEVEAATIAVFAQVSNRTKLEPLGGKLTPGGDRIEAAQTAPGSTVVLAYEHRFSDVPPSHWAYQTIHEMAARQVLRGVTSTEFGPQQPITRGQLAAILVRALNLGEDDRFARIYYDISPYDALAPEIGGAIRAGMMMGYPDGTFRPNAPVTRQELAVVLSRMAERLNLPGAIDREVAERLARMADWNSVAPWAQDGVRYAVSEGLMVGRSATTWAPLEQTTRAEAATVIQRLLDKVAPGEWR